MKKTLIIAVLLSIALTACGGSAAPSLSAFKAGFAGQRKTFRTLGVDLQQAIATAQNKTDAQLAKEIAALAVRAKNKASSLATLNPPSRYKTALHTLEVGFNAIAADLRQITAAATKHDAATARSATLALIKDASTVKAGDTAITSGLHLSANG
jgi:hypothetical protein